MMATSQLRRAWGWLMAIQMFRFGPRKVVPSCFQEHPHPDSCHRNAGCEATSGQKFVVYINHLNRNKQQYLISRPLLRCTV
jgi:hypothetical protein